MFQFPIITGYMTGLMTGHFAPDTAELINRARADLRMGVPVVLCGHGSAALVLAAETMGPARLATLRALGGAPVLAITGRRAETLKARPYDGDVARLPLPEEADCAWIRAIADPADDLRTPMKGPLFALREGDAALHRLAVSLVKSAQLLPAAVVLETAVESLPEAALLTRLEAGSAGPLLLRATDPHPVVAARLPPGWPMADGCTSSAPMMAGSSTTPSRSAARIGRSRCWHGCIPPVSPAMCWAR